MSYHYAINFPNNFMGKSKFFRFVSKRHEQLWWLQRYRKRFLKKSSKLRRHNAYDTSSNVCLSSEADVSSEVDSSSKVNVDFDLSLPTNDSTSPGNQLNIDDTSQLDNNTSVPLNPDMPLKVLEEIQRLKSAIYNERIRAKSLQKKNRVLQMEITDEKMQCSQVCKKLERINDKYTTLLTKICKVPIIQFFAKELNGPTGKWSLGSLKCDIEIESDVDLHTYDYMTEYLGISLPSYSTICDSTNKLSFEPSILRDMTTLIKSKGDQL